MDDALHSWINYPAIIQNRTSISFLNMPAILYFL